MIISKLMFYWVRQMEPYFILSFWKMVEYKIFFLFHRCKLQWKTDGQKEISKLSISHMFDVSDFRERKKLRYLINVAAKSNVLREKDYRYDCEYGKDILFYNIENSSHQVENVFEFLSRK